MNDSGFKNNFNLTANPDSIVLKTVSEESSSDYIKYEKIPQDIRDLVDDLATTVFDPDGGRTLVVGYPGVGKSFIIEQFAFNIDVFLSRTHFDNFKLINVTKSDYSKIALLDKSGFAGYMKKYEERNNLTSEEICYVTESPEVAASIFNNIRNPKIILEANISTFMNIMKGETSGLTKIWSTWEIIDVNSSQCSKENLIDILYESLSKRIKISDSFTLTKKHIAIFVNYCIRHNPKLEIEVDGQQKVLIPPGFWAQAIRRLVGVISFSSDEKLIGKNGNKVFGRVVGKVYRELESEFEQGVKEFSEQIMINKDEDDHSDDLSSLLDLLGVSGGGNVLIKPAFITNNDKDNEEESLQNTDINTEKLRFKDIGTLATRLKDQVVGQDEAIDRIVDGMMVSAAGLSDSIKPLRSVLLLGPTGVGKTKLALTLSSELMDKPMNLVRIDMSEYSEAHEAAKLFGAPPGYVGYGNGGILTSAVKKNPYSLILLDEVEKAHPKIWDTFLQVFDAGRLTDGSGEIVDFSKTVIIMTSNLGVNEINRKSTGFNTNLSNTNYDKKDTEKIIQNAVNEFFRPEFINRLDDIVLFNNLSKDTVLQILKKEIDIVSLRAEAKGFSINTPDDEILDRLLQLSDVSKYGAREIQRVVLKNISNPIAKVMLSKGKKKRRITLFVDSENNIAVK